MVIDNNNNNNNNDNNNNNNIIGEKRYHLSKYGQEHHFKYEWKHYRFSKYSKPAVSWLFFS